MKKYLILFLLIIISASSMAQDTTGKPPMQISPPTESSGFDFGAFDEKVKKFLKDIKKRSKICAGAKTKLYDESFLSVYVHLNEEVKKSKECKACQETQNKLSPYLNCLFAKSGEKNSLHEIANVGMTYHLQLAERELIPTAQSITDFYTDLDKMINPKNSNKKDEK